MELEFSKHALARMDVRNISKEEVIMVVEHPDSVLEQ